MQRANIDVPRLFRLWNSTLSNADLCLALGVSRSRLDTLRMRYKLPRRPRPEKEHTDAAENDPSAEEIASMAAAIRAGWSDIEEQRRIVGRQQARWAAPRYCFDGRDTAFMGISH